ncbi:hypothetical protein RR48_07575 [Papilio machaon]|uniref:Uncharacterized protein n=1 Tax=Papilio machaon TaxID=76193 RepID=A0A194QP82_PAPMA|nr:hypothetical protein RR48_07575 [Papilio machaon]
MEKEHQPDSMATITMKPEYPPSEVYSASEPPPAYRQRVSSSVQIARIAAVTIIASSFILGSFVLASSWVAARASCHQLEQLDAMLDKELALEGRSYGNDGLVVENVNVSSNKQTLYWKRIALAGCPVEMHPRPGVNDRVRNFPHTNTHTYSFANSTAIVAAHNATIVRRRGDWRGYVIAGVFYPNGAREHSPLG